MPSAVLHRQLIAPSCKSLSQFSAGEPPQLLVIWPAVSFLLHELNPDCGEHFVTGQGNYGMAFAVELKPETHKCATDKKLSVKFTNDSSVDVRCRCRSVDLDVNPDKLKKEMVWQDYLNHHTA